MEPTLAIPKALNARQEEADKNNNMLFGFWVYIMTDCILFASLFATYAVLHNNIYTGPSGAQIFSLPYVLGETLLLLTSSFSCGLATISLQNRSKNKVLLYFLLTFLLGACFLFMEVKDFNHLIAINDSWTRSGFLSAFFALVSTHGLHIAVGLLWMAVMMIRVIKSGLTSHNVRRLKMLAIFWHFLDVIWIFIFTVVYLFGALKL